MKRATLLLLGAMFFVAGNTAGQDKDKPKFDFEAAAKAAEPGPGHKVLEPLIGSWTYQCKFWLDPSQPPMEMAGTSERKWILGGRYVQENYRGNEKERPFEGQGLLGYDVSQKKYFTAWVDNMGTGIMHSTGTADSTGRAITYQSECFCPMEKRQVKGREVLTLESPDRQRLEMFRVTPDGKEMKMMEITLTRSKK